MEAADPPQVKRKLADLRAQRDELKETVQTQDKLISTLGLDDDEKVKRIKRILAMADKEGGLDEVERRLDLFKQRQKSDYVAVVLGTAMSLKPNDVIGIVDKSLIFVDWPQGKKIRFSMCRVFDVYAGEA